MDLRRIVWISGLLAVVLAVNGPLTGSAQGPRGVPDATYLGYTVGRWEGETLVLDSIAFVDSTWLGRGGFFRVRTQQHLHPGPPLAAVGAVVSPGCEI